MNSFELDESKLKYNKELLYLSEEDLPQKVLAICRSVIALYNGGTRFTKMTISEIAKHAGIGKGTVYEYFESKEEIIITAMLIELKSQLVLICDVILSQESFYEKYNAALAWIVEHVKSNEVLRQMLLARYSENSHQAMCMLIDKMMHHTKANIVLDSILDAGVKEGRFQRPSSVLQEKAAYATFIFGVYASLQPEEFGNQPQEEVLKYCRNLFIQILNPFMV